MKYTQQDIQEILDKMKRKEMTKEDFKKVEEIFRYMNILDPENPLVEFKFSDVPRKST